MEKLEKQPITIKEYRDKLKKLTCDVNELAEILGVSVSKARRFVHIEGAPVVRFGRDYRIILSKLDAFLEEHIGDIL